MIDALMRKIADLDARIERLEAREGVIWLHGGWTPTLAGATTAGTFTYSVQQGRYTRLGNMVVAWCAIQISAISVAAAGGLRITGLPVTAGSGTLNEYGGAVGAHSVMNMDAGYTQVGATVPAGGSYIQVYEGGDNLTAAFFPSANLAVNSYLDITVMYEV